MEKIEKVVIAIGAILILGSIVAVYYMGVIYHQKANGHPESECPKVEQVQPRSHFLSTPKIVVPSKANRVIALQNKHGLKVDGIIGKETKTTCYGQCWED